MIGIGNLPILSVSEATTSNGPDCIAGQTIGNQGCFAADCFSFPALWVERISTDVSAMYLLAADNDDDDDSDSDAAKKDTAPEPPDRIANSACCA